MPRTFGPYATADEIALALVCACRLTGDDPLEVIANSGDRMCGDPMVRWYAAEALRLFNPHLNFSAIARGVGYKSHRISPVQAITQLMRSGKWDTTIVHKIAKELRLAAGLDESKVGMKAPARKPERSEDSGQTAALMGDPPANRVIPAT